MACPCSTVASRVGQYSTSTAIVRYGNYEARLFRWSDDRERVTGYALVAFEGKSPTEVTRFEADHDDYRRNTGVRGRRLPVAENSTVRSLAEDYTRHGVHSRLATESLSDASKGSLVQ